MLKRLCCLFSLIAVPLCSLALPTSATICYNGKSSGSFVLLSEASPLTVLNRNGVSFPSTKDEAKALIELLNAEQTHFFESDGVKNYYFYTPKIANKEVVFNKRVNLHVAVTKNGVTIGSPIIYYGY